MKIGLPLERTLDSRPGIKNRTRRFAGGFSVLFAVAVISILLPGRGFATCFTGGVPNGICDDDQPSTLAPADWYFSDTLFGTGAGQVGGFTAASDLADLTGLIQTDYTDLVADTSLTFQGGEAGFDAAALGKLTNLELAGFITTLTFLDSGDFDPSVAPEVGNGFGAFTLTAPAPEPGTLVSMLGGAVLLGLVGLKRRIRR